MSVHWRPILREAPWGIGRNERHHGPIRYAYIRITAEAPSLAINLTFAMTYKARNDASRAHGSSPTAAITGEAPRLLIGDDHHFDTFIAARQRAIPTARGTMESCTAADRLRGALSHLGTIDSSYEVDQNVWFHRERQRWLRGSAHSLNDKTVYVRHNGRICSSHESRTKPFVSRRSSPSPVSHACPVSASHAPIRTHTPASAAPSALPDHSRVFLASASHPVSPSHPR